MDNPKKSIKRSILNKFRSYLNVENDVLPVWWLAVFRERLDDQGRAVFHQALIELVETGIVEQIHGQGLKSGLKLTVKGDYLVYNR